MCSINNFESKKVKILSKSELSNLGSKPEKTDDKNNNSSSIVPEKSLDEKSIISKKEISEFHYPRSKQKSY